MCGGAAAAWCAAASLGSSGADFLCDDDESAEAYRAAGADVASGKTLKCINSLPGQLAIAHCRRFPQAASPPQQDAVPMAVPVQVEESSRFGLRRNRSSSETL